MAAVAAARQAWRAVAGAHVVHPGATGSVARLLSQALETATCQEQGSQSQKRSVQGQGWYARGTPLEIGQAGEEQGHVGRGQGWGIKALGCALLSPSSSLSQSLSSSFGSATASIPLRVSLHRSTGVEGHCMSFRACVATASVTGPVTEPPAATVAGIGAGPGNGSGSVPGGAQYSGLGRRVGGTRRSPKFGRFFDREIPVTNFLNEDCGSIKLPGIVFDVPVRKDIVHSVVRWQLAKRRAGTASTLTVGEVRGTSKKPFPQKGTGRARQGTLRAPHMRGGATMHGPKPRSHAHSLPKKVRRLGLRIALSARLAEGKLVVYQDLEPGSHKTKEMAQHLASAFPSSKKFLLVDHVPKEEPDSTSSTSNTDSTVSAVSAVSTSNEAAGAPGEASSGGVGSGNTEGLVPPPESDSDAVSESHLQSQSQAQSQGESGVHSEGGEAGQAAKEGFTTVRDVYGRLTLRPWSKEERLAHRLARKKAQVHLQRVGEKLVKATGNLHYVSVLPTLGLNVYSILQHDTLVMSAKAVQGTIERLHPKWPSQREKKIMELIAQRRQGQQQKQQQQQQQQQQ